MKYKLKIPKEYREVLAPYFLDYDNMILVKTKNKDEYCVYPGSGVVHVTLINIPEVLVPVLLEEIKDEPVSALVWVDDKVTEHGVCDKCQRLNMNAFDIFRAGEANNELRHKPKQTLEGVFYE